MYSPRRILAENACYHLITRGNQKQMTFKEQEDYLAYLSLLKRFKHRYKFKLYAWCIMPNHVHLLGEIENQIFLSSFMHDLNRTYTSYFNNKYGKVGHLWQGRFKSMIITKNQYLVDCINYIETNPIRSNLVKHVSQYLWSSYRARALGQNDKATDPLDII